MLVKLDGPERENLHKTIAVTDAISSILEKACPTMRGI
jgi:hypothetical protein